MRLVDEGLAGLEQLIARKPRQPGLTANDIWDWLPGKNLEFAIMIGRGDRGARLQRAINATYSDLQDFKAQAAAATDLNRKARLYAQAVRTACDVRLNMLHQDVASWGEIKTTGWMPCSRENRRRH